MNSLSPIVLFTYRRFETLQKTVQCLSDNFLASDSDLIIYSDGAKNINDKEIITKIRAYLKTISGFKSVTVHESITNKGLAASIIQGVSATLKEHHKVIVLEDDLITSTNFLTFMNASLSKYENNNNVYSISGYVFDFNINSIDKDAYFLNRHWPWGWATWENRWNNVDWDVSDYEKFKRNKILRKKYSLLGSDVNAMLDKQMNGNLDSWSIRWTFHVFKQDGLVLFPKISKIENNGWDISATNNVGLKNRYESAFDRTNKLDFNLPDEIKINPNYQKLLIRKMSIWERLKNKIKESFFLYFR